MISMLDSIYSIKKTGGIAPKASTNKNRIYTSEFKINALSLMLELGSRNKAAQELGIAPSLLSTFSKQKAEGRF